MKVRISTPSLPSAAPTQRKGWLLYLGHLIWAAPTLVVLAVHCFVFVGFCGFRKAAKAVGYWPLARFCAMVRTRSRIEVNRLVVRLWELVSPSSTQLQNTTSTTKII